MKKGRPVKSVIRDNIVSILKNVGKGYGYEIYKMYSSEFEKKVTLRSIYYNLHKGVKIGVFSVINEKDSTNNVDKKMYELKVK